MLRLSSVDVPARDPTLPGAHTLVADAFHCSPDNVEGMRTELSGGRQVVTYCITEER